MEMGHAQKAAIESVPLDAEFSELFDCTEVEAVASPTQAVPDHTPETMQDLDDGVSLEQASKLLGLHTDTIKKRLRKGTLKGFKVAEKYGERWLVSRSALPSHTLQVVASPAQAVPDHAPQVVTSPTQAVPDHTLDRADSPAISVADHISDASAIDAKLVTIIENQAHQLKAAGDVIMYLRSQIEDKENQLKLLTDSQHKRGWWSSFYSWFTTGWR